MKWMRLSLLPVSLVVAAALALAAGPAGAAFPLRSPQVVVPTPLLQGYLNSVGESITVGTDQVDAQTFSTGFTGNTDFTLTLKTASGAAIGVYNTFAVGAPALNQLFPAGAIAGYSCYCHFGSTGTLAVSLYDENFNFLGVTNYTGVNRIAFGFYIQSAGGLWFAQDSRNGGAPQILTYAGTGVNTGDWWECFEAMPYGPNASFIGAVLVLQSVIPTPTAGTTWGSVKQRYR